MEISLEEAKLILDKFNNDVKRYDKLLIQKIFHQFPELKNCKQYKHMHCYWRRVRINYINQINKEYLKILGRGKHNLALKEYTWIEISTDDANKVINMIINDKNISKYTVENNG